ncbi:sigma 54-interacting transcriptional regulator [Robertmurraya massiliosenegalensis]
MKEEEVNSYKELSEKMRDLETAIQACQEGIYICDKDTVCLYVNRAYERISGMTSKEIIGHTSLEMEKRGVISQSVALKVIKEQRIISLVQTFSTGKEALVTGTPVYGEKGELGRIVITARDMTELYSLEKKLRKVEEEKNHYLTELKFYQKRSFNKDMVAKSRYMQSLLETIGRVASVDSTILLLGESGVGKEVLAKQIHDLSNRRDHSFTKINCGAIPAELLESELFGYVKGAFTGADQKGKAGLFEIADQGTLFLDEIGELPPSLQVKLLRVLQDFEVKRLGSNTSKNVNVRIISATNKNLEEMVQQGQFREDLFYRINVIPLSVLPLRERRDDIQPLIYQTLNKLSEQYKTNRTIELEALEYLERYSWPGNIRELKNVIERLFVIVQEPIIRTDHLPSYIREGKRKEMLSIGDSSLKEKLSSLEKQLITEALKRNHTLSKAAKELKVDVSTLSRKCQRYNIAVQKTIEFID